MSTAIQIVRDIEQKPEQIALVESLYTSLKSSVQGIISNEGVSTANIIIIVDAGMKLAAKLNTLDGIEKKALVMTVVRKLISESTLKPEEEAVIQILAERALDPMIDQLFLLTPKIYGKIKAGCMSCFKKP